MKWLILGLTAVAVFPAGCTTPSGGASTGTATVEGQSTVDTGEAGIVDVTADGQSSQSSGDATMTGDAPTDRLDDDPRYAEEAQFTSPEAR